MIHSKDNAKVKLASQLLRSKKKRNESSQFVCDTKEACGHILKHYPESVAFVLYEEKASDFLKDFSISEESCFLVETSIFKGISPLKHSFGAVIILNMRSVELTKPAVALGLWRINNPSNLGAIIRSAYAFSCKKIYLIGDCCDEYHPEAVRASAGHIFDTEFHHISEDKLQDLGDDYELIKMQGHSENKLSEFVPSMPLLILMGSEQGFCDSTSLSTIKPLSISTTPNCESLNLAVAASIVLHHCYKSCFT